MPDLQSRIARFTPHLRGVTPGGIGHDLVAGLTVAALAVPQGIAYALVAGLPPQMGLLAAALPTVIAGLFGSSRFLVTGPTIPIALLLGVSVVGPVTASGAPVPIGAVLQTALLAGFMLTALALLGFGRASRFLSDSVVAGFAVGVGLLIVLRHVPMAVGAGSALRVEASLVPSVWWVLVDGARALFVADPRALVLATLVPLGVIGLRRLDRRLPAGLIALVSAGVVAAALGWTHGPDALQTLQQVRLGWPELHVPPLFDLQLQGPSALAIALLATLQTIAAARALEDGPVHRLDSDRELFGQGMANVTASLVGAMPTSGSLSRSAAARAAGARSRLAAVSCGLILLLVLPWIGPLLARLPLAALGGFVVLSGLELIDLRALRRAATTRGDALILAVTIGTTLWIDLMQAVYAGVFISLALLVRRAGRLQMVEVVQVEHERLREIPIDEQTGRSPVVVLHLEGDLNFAVAARLGDELETIVHRGPRMLILRLKRARHLDATVLEVLRRVMQDLADRGATLRLCGLTDEIAASLERTELGRGLGPEGVLRSGPRLFEGFERALDQARKLLAPRSDAEIFRCEDRTRWSYEI